MKHKSKMRWALPLLFCLMTLIQRESLAQDMDHHHWEDWPDLLQTITVSGIAIVDSSYMYPRYYLDVDADDTIDYQTSFGPWWYQPKSGAKRPAQGHIISIVGGLVPQFVPPLIVVYEINGLRWRDPTGPPPWSGDWVRRNATDTTFVYCPTDSLDRLEFPPGCMMGMMFPDSIYCEFNEIHADSLPKANSTFFAGYHIDLFNPNGSWMMGSNMMMGFSRDVQLHFHYNDQQLASRGLSEQNITLLYYTDSEWKPIAGLTVDTKSNTLSLSQKILGTYYALSASPVTSVEVVERNSITPTGYALFPNYPNPFNPETVIRFQTPEQEKVMVKIFDLHGRVVKNLVQEFQQAGIHSVTWDGYNDHGTKVGSGVYLVVLKTRKFTDARKIILLH